jgi:hypothetical protein
MERVKCGKWEGSRIIVDYGQVIQIESYRETGTARYISVSTFSPRHENHRAAHWWGIEPSVQCWLLAEVRSEITDVR